MNMAFLTFIIPVRHPQNAVSWEALKSRLSDTVASLSAQDCDDWSCVIVANVGADLPALPEKFIIERVDFPPNPVHERRDGVSDVDFLKAVRLDKGRRVLAGMLRSRESRYLMVVDDDDFVSRRLVSYVRSQDGSNGWMVYYGYMWGEGGWAMLMLSNFNMTCGTSLVIRSDLYDLPSSAGEVDEERVMTMFGSHYRTHKLLEARGVPLEKMPFPAAIYRVGQAGSHSKLPGVLGGYIFNLQILQQPRKLFKNLRRLRFLTESVRSEFFGKK